MTQHFKIFFLLLLSSLLFMTVFARGETRGGDGGGYYYRNYPNAARTWENRGDWDNYGNEIYAPSYPYTYPYNDSSYYPNYDEYNSPQYEQQPSDAEAATFPYHPV